MRTQKKGANKLENYCWKRLVEEKIPFVYEREFELLPSFESKAVIIEKVNRGMRRKRSKHLNMIISPDFSGNNWVIETKGLRRPDFDLRWKLFKHLIKEEDWLLLMPGNQTQVDVSIQILKDWLSGRNDWSNKELLQIEEDLKLLAKSRSKPKATKTKER